MALSATALAGTGVAPAAATPSAAPGPGADGAGAAADGTTPRLRVLTYNVFLMSKNLYPNWGQDHRAREIPKAAPFRGNDVVVLQEAFDNASSDALKSNAAGQYPHQTPVLGRSKSGWDATHGAYSATTPEDGGVTVLSKWPVVKKEQYVYKQACGGDYFSNKGFVYAVLDVNGTRVHVVGTHTQSTDDGCTDGQAPKIRSAQLKEMDAFLDAKKIPADEQVMVAGDLNVDAASPEHASMLADAGLSDSDSRTGRGPSFDTEHNSVAADRYPGLPSEDLDYVLHREGHARPDGWRNEVLDERSEPWTVSSWGKKYTYTNMSDHYPVVAR
ncbi:sphingomyelin phosphodiesterase [Streptomyces iconiensis]|uniref:sphingomyelin phosphodiesterase n=1 Tax=Streptomyces iconiensis TaxID=1384038 RepID=UPI003D2F5EE7